MPLTFDLPWEQLQSYRGVTPRPDDFDVYWDRALQELADLDPQAAWRDADFQTPFAHCQHLTYTGVRGARVHAKVLRPRRLQQPGPALIQFHGYSANAGDWVSKLGYVAAGWTVAAMDCRGQGGASEDIGGVKGTTLRGHIIRGLDGPPEDLLFRHIFLDAVELTRLIARLDEVDPNRLAVTGASQGGGLALACAALAPNIRRVAPVYPFLCDYRRVWQIDLACDAYAELQEYFRRFDPLHQREDEIFTRLGYIDVQHLVPRIGGKVLMGIGLMDTVCPPSTQMAAYNRITAEKTLRVYPDFGHEALPGHDDAVFQFMMEMA